MSITYFNLLLARRREKTLRKLHRRNLRDASNPFELPDREFQKTFRSNKPMVQYLCIELHSSLEPVNQVDGLPVHIKVLACLRLLGDGNYQRRTDQDHTICIAQTTVSRYLTQFTNAVVSELFPKWTFFPASEAQRKNMANGFQTKHGVPDIVGAIDCMHVAISHPKKPHGDQYKNRNGFHSINTQLVCDVNSRILHINARYPGSVHDQFIFDNSNLKQELQRLYTCNIGAYYLLGDSSYVLEPWLMTPVFNAPVDSPAQKYTEWHCQVRNCVERANGYLKGTFRCLGHDRVLRYDPQKSAKIIYTCATLYNIMIHYRVPFETSNVEDVIQSSDEDEDGGEGSSASLLNFAEDKRQGIITNYFT